MGIVECLLTTLGKILPIGKFGKTGYPKAVFWNFYPQTRPNIEELLTNWKNNSLFGQQHEARHRPGNEEADRAQRTASERFVNKGAGFDS
jgi:hypothetical protein